MPGIDFSLQDAAAIGIIGGADGPTAIFLASRLSPELLGAIAVAAYSYMALVPIIQPPIMRALTTEEERAVAMDELRPVSTTERILFPFTVLLLVVLLLPAASPLIGMLMFGNLLREAGVVERLSQTAQNELINIVTILLGLTVGSRLAADTFLSVETIGILAIGLVAFAVGTATGVLMGKAMHRLTGGQVNPLIGARGGLGGADGGPRRQSGGPRVQPEQLPPDARDGPERGRRDRVGGGRRVPALDVGVVAAPWESVRTPGGVGWAPSGGRHTTLRRVRRRIIFPRSCSG